MSDLSQRCRFAGDRIGTRSRWSIHTLESFNEQTDSLMWSPPKCETSEDTIDALHWRMGSRLGKSGAIFRLRYIRSQEFTVARPSVPLNGERRRASSTQALHFASSSALIAS